MSYSTVQNVTPIDMLPELEELERGHQMGGGMPHQPPPKGSSYSTSGNYAGSTMIPSEEVERVGRFIRGGYTAPPEAGMAPYHDAAVPMNPIEPMNSGMSQDTMEQYGTPIGEDKGVRTITMPTDSPSCLHVAEHIMNCPICSKFYNNDKTIYIIAIIVLVIVCVLLLKKVLDL